VLSEVQIAKCEITPSICTTGRDLHLSFRKYGLFSLTVEVSGFMGYQLHVEGVVLYF
jgi:hypothetical protein